MRYQSAIYALALSITSTYAQNIGDIPTCAYTAALSSISSTTCAITDIKCICQSSDWIKTLLPEVSKACSAADLDKTRTITIGLCKSVGVDLVLPSDTTGSISPATATSATKSAASSTSAAVVGAAKSGASAAATSASSVVASLASSASAAAATATKTGSATALGPQSGLLGMMGIAMGMMVL